MSRFNVKGKVVRISKIELKGSASPTSHNLFNNIRISKIELKDHFSLNY